MHDYTVQLGLSGPFDKKQIVFGMDRTLANFLFKKKCCLTFTDMPGPHNGHAERPWTYFKGTGK